MNKKDMLNNKYAKDIREMIERNILPRKSNMPISHLSLLCAKSKRFIEKEGETLDLKEVVRIIEKEIGMKIVPLFLNDEIMSNSKNTIVIVPVFSNQIIIKHERLDLAGMEFVHQGDVVAKINENGVFESC